MPDKKVSDLTAATTPLAGTELVPIVQSGTSKKVAQSDLAVPADGSITGAKIASSIKDAAAGTASLRTLGTSSTSAMAGDKNLATIAAPTADVDLNSKKITNLADPSSAQDAVTKAYSDLRTTTATFLGYTEQSSSAVDVVPRWVATSNQGQTSGTVYFQFFTAPQTITVSQIGYVSQSSTSTLTLARFGLYTWDESTTTATLVARTASDTTLFASGNTLYTRSFDTTGGYPSTYTLTAGTRYVTAVIQVGSTAANLFSTPASVGAITTLVPRMSGAAASQTDLPTSRNTFTSQTPVVYARLS